MLPFFVKVHGAIAKRLCTGLQIRLAQFDSGSRLQCNARTPPRVRAFFLFAHLAHSQHTFDVAKHLRHAVQKTCFLLNRVCR
jgi:hypothetical protein